MKNMMLKTAAVAVTCVTALPSYGGARVRHDWWYAKISLAGLIS